MFRIVFGIFAFIVVFAGLYFAGKSISSTKCDNADKYIELLKFQDTAVDTEKISNNSVKVNRLSNDFDITPFTLKDLKITRKIDDNGNKTLILTGINTANNGQTEISVNHSSVKLYNNYTTPVCLKDDFEWADS